MNLKWRLKLPDTWCGTETAAGKGGAVVNELLFILLLYKHIRTMSATCSYEAEEVTWNVFCPFWTEVQQSSVLFCIRGADCGKSLESVFCIFMNIWTILLYALHTSHSLNVKYLSGVRRFAFKIGFDSGEFPYFRESLKAACAGLFADRQKKRSSQLWRAADWAERESVCRSSLVLSPRCVQTFNSHYLSEPSPFSWRIVAVSYSCVGN